MKLIARSKALAKQAILTAAELRRRWREWSWRTWPKSWRRPFEVVETFDVWAYLDELTESVSAVLADGGIEHIVVSDRNLPRPMMVVRRPDASRALEVLKRDDRSRSWWLAVSDMGLAGTALPMGRRRLLGGTGVIVVRNLVSRDGVPLTHSELGVQVDFWTELTELPGGGEPIPGTYGTPQHNGVLDHVGPELWATAQRNGHRLPEAPPHLLLVNEPIDLVFTWVDGSDPAWLARKATALGKAPDPGYSADAAIDARFENRDELRYSLRSVEMFANWVRHIWIVTDRQRPSWLRPDDRLTVVDHSEIFADPSVLPVFNSHAIESQLHHIPGLAEHYLYLNDDMLFGSPVRPEDFYHGNGISKFFASPALIDAGGHTSDDLAVTAAAKNNRDLIERQFGRTISNKLRHTPQPQCRSLLEQFEADHPELFDQVMRSRFRHASDHSLPSSLSQYYAFAKQRAVTGRLVYGYVDLASSEPGVMLDRWLRRRDLQCFCVNDSGEDAEDDRPAKAAMLSRFFEQYFPLPSRWERTDAEFLGSPQRRKHSHALLNPSRQHGNSAR